MNTLFIPSILIVSMYLISGYGKIMDINGNAFGLKNKTGVNIPLTLFILSIVIVIFLEIVGSSVILYSSYTGNIKRLAYYFTNALIAFTLLATLIYHMPIELNNHALFKNMAITGGLILLADRFNK